MVGAGAGCSDDSDGSATGSRREFCAELRAVVEAHLTIFDPLQPASREDTGQAMDRLAAAAPEAIATEMTLLADTFEAVVEVLDEVNPSDPEAADRLAALDIDEDEIAAAQATVNAFALDKCRIDLAAINAAVRADDIDHDVDDPAATHHRSGRDDGGPDHRGADDGAAGLGLSVRDQASSRRLATTLSMIPYSLASSAVNQRSRSESSCTCSTVWPVCSAMRSAMSFFV